MLGNHRRSLNVNIYMPAKILCASPGMKPLLLGMAAGAQVNNFLKDGLPNFRHQNDMVVTKRLQAARAAVLD